jgi:hypothetical protein
MKGFWEYWGLTGARRCFLAAAAGSARIAQHTARAASFSLLMLAPCLVCNSPMSRKLFNSAEGAALPCPPCRRPLDPHTAWQYFRIASRCPRRDRVEI